MSNYHSSLDPLSPSDVHPTLNQPHPNTQLKSSESNDLTGSLIENKKGSNEVARTPQIQNEKTKKVGDLIGISNPENMSLHGNGASIGEQPTAAQTKMSAGGQKFPGSIKSLRSSVNESYDTVPSPDKSE
jgi:hypothetical protein